ncbi:MAG: hypothetical protein ACE5GR_08860 [Nitrosopumilus sp.]
MNLQTKHLSLFAILPLFVGILIGGSISFSDAVLSDPLVDNNPLHQIMLIK